MSANGKFFVKKSNGTKVYKPKAMYHVANSSAKLVKVTKNHKIPAAIRPAMLGCCKKLPIMTEARAYQIIFNKPMPKNKKTTKVNKTTKVKVRMFKRSNPFFH